jgi:catechol-2,3-dioxygenase
MFKNTRAFSSFSVNDLEKAREFYHQILGLDVTKEAMGVLTVQVEGGNKIIIYPKPDHVPATFTILNFPVADLEEAVDKLIELGISFEQYGGELQTNEKGILRGDGRGPDIAWFKDPAGNILSVIQQ